MTETVWHFTMALKNVDLNALSKSFDGIQKILDLVSGFVVKDDQKPQQKQWYDD